MGRAPCGFDFPRWRSKEITLSFEEEVLDFGACLSDYSALWQQYRRNGFNRTLDSQDKENALKTDWALSHYYSTGADALRIVVKNLLAAGLAPPSRILDFPCGSGRVLRHMRAMFPDAEIGACDLYEEHVEFCAKQFGAKPIMSCEDLSTLNVGQWDIVFCGSLLTHLPEALFWPAMEFMIRSLVPGGIAIVTLEGRRANYIQDNLWKLIPDEQFALIREGYRSTGFGYSNYHQEFRDEKFNAQESYGVALVRPDWLMSGLTQRDSITIQNFSEADWDKHQDVIVIRNRPVGFGEPSST